MVFQTRRSKLLTVSFILILCGAVLTLLINSRTVFEGGSLKNDEEYSLAIIKMSGRTFMKFTLKRGIVLTSILER